MKLQYCPNLFLQDFRIEKYFTEVKTLILRPLIMFVTAVCVLLPRLTLEGTQIGGKEKKRLSIMIIFKANARSFNPKVTQIVHF